MMTSEETKDSAAAKWLRIRFVCGYIQAIVEMVIIMVNIQIGGHIMAMRFDKELLNPNIPRTIRVHACPFCEEPRNTLKCLILQGLASFGEGKPGVIIYRKMVWFDAKSV